MSYIQVPLPVVPVPPPAHRGRYALQLASVWAGYMMFFVAAMWALFTFVIPVASELRHPLAALAILFGFGGLFAALPALLHSSGARDERWKRVAQPIYAQRAGEIKGWKWPVKAAAIFDGKWRVVCEGQPFDPLISIPVAHVEPVPGDRDELTFSQVTFPIPDGPRGRHYAHLGGTVTLAYDEKRGGPPPLTTNCRTDKEA